MKIFIRNILLLVVVLIFAYFSRDYFGAWYDRFSPLYDTSIFPIPEHQLIKLTGFPFAYIFFLIVTFKLLGRGNVNKWIGWLLVPPALFFGAGDLKHIYLPITLGLVAWGIAVLLQKVFRKQATTNM